MTKSCESEYIRGKIDRKKIPLGKGAYKIREICSNTSNYLDALQRIGDHRVHNRQGNIELRPCMSNETATYVRGFPSRVCRRFSYNIQPAVQALVNNGVPAATVKNIEKWLSVEVKESVEMAELARLDVISDWKGTARDLEARTGLVYEFAERFRYIVERVMEKAGIHVCSSCGLTECGRVMGTQKECI